MRINYDEIEMNLISNPLANKEYKNNNTERSLAVSQYHILEVDFSKIMNSGRIFRYCIIPKMRFSKIVPIASY
ncbi:hypothetical protein CWR48_06115 [Oceanobacillus arenosus]|uniref:Uncharacterized protein n=1 Tax=Oceanobacillus arenosus TaxID=1229153 RepID=A0A3D8PXK5_9BACI|nr:hypothetical protein CWR48_06115 [Oceanobacillus arenosus]